MKITEYTVVRNGNTFFVKLGENMYYKTYEDTGIQIAETMEWASHIAKEQFALELIGFLQNFFDSEGKVRPENKGKVIPPIVGMSEAAEMLGWQKQQVSVYMQRGKFPEPLQRLASGPIWTWKQIEDFRDSRRKEQ